MVSPAILRRMHRRPRLLGAGTVAAVSEDAPVDVPTSAITVEPVTDGSHIDDLQHADASRDSAYEELLLLEKHIKTAPCPRCMSKHAITARGLLNEAAGLAGGRPQDATVLAAHVEHARRTLPTDSKAALTELQSVRLVLGEILGHHRPYGALPAATTSGGT